MAIVAIILGASLAVIGPIYTVILLIALIGAVWVIADLQHALWSILLIITLLPFATLPFKIVITPTFLDLAMAAALAIYLLEWMTGERRKLSTTPVHPFIIVFMVLAVFSFTAGLRYAGLTSTVLRRFAELILSMGFALILVDILKDEKDLKYFILVLLAGGATAGLLAIVFWILPDLLAERILLRLSVFGYPSAGIIRYIEQNPELAERAIGTSVNPNALGGLMVMIGSLAAPQIITDSPVARKRWLGIVMLAFVVGALILTFSRGSMLAFGVALIFIATLRYPRMLIILPVLALILLVVPFSQEYISRFVEGFQFADLATQMRLGEYKDALILIGRYPLLGVGFAGVPDIDIYLGVASVYLTMASNMGLLGLGAFFLLITATFIYAWSARKHVVAVSGLEAIWLGLLAGLIGALTNGILDHYFFNLEFMAAVTIFWIYVGLTLAVTRISLESSAQKTGE